MAVYFFFFFLGQFANAACMRRLACVWGKVVGKTDKISDRHARHGLSDYGIAHGPVAAVRGWREPASIF
jgi:hypothetical protein